MWALGISIAIIVSAVVILGLIFIVVRSYQRKARRAGHSSIGEYLRAAPRSNEEIQEAVDLTLKGVVICILGLLFPPFLLIGVVALYYGARKIAYSSLGLGLFDDAEPSA